MESLLDDGDQNIGGDGDPDLRLNAILGSPVEGFDPQMLLDPFEKELDLPAAAYSSVIVNAGKAKLLVRKTRVLAVSGSLKRMRRKGGLRNSGASRSP